MFLRSTYSIGDTLSFEDMNYEFPICNSDNDFLLGDTFKFSDLNGDFNGGNYRITLVSMNATW